MFYDGCEEFEPVLLEGCVTVGRDGNFADLVGGNGKTSLGGGRGR